MAITYTDCITFTGETSDFTLKATYKEWDGTVEYSTDHNTWTVWDGSEISSSGKKLYLRGSGNTTFYSGIGIYFVLSARAACSGNIQTLLEYSNPPTSIPSNECYLNMFANCTSLTQAPELPATTLTINCYNNMFAGCTSLTQAPILPATNLAGGCYNRMFAACTSLTQAPALPATTLTDWCYKSMFYGCTSLATAPELSATTLADHCYHDMFYECTNLTAAPELPATTLADSCYQSMFYGCTSLTKAPALPATTLIDWCYDCMFQDCTNLKISTIQSSEYPTAWRIPSSGTIASTASSWNGNMLAGTGGTFTDDPSINTTYYGAWSSVETYNITYNLTNCTGVSTNPTTINEGDTATLSFTSNEGYSFPDEVTVTGVESYTWDKSTGTLILTNATGNVNITINCMANRKSIDLTTLPGWSSLSSGSHNITIVARADGYRDSEPSAAVSVTKGAEEYTDCITFTGESSDFTLSVGGAKEWDGTVEYSTDHNTWTEWDGSEISSSGQKLYLRGSGNTKFYTSNGARFVLSAKAACSGNLNTLLEYSNPPTTLANYCYMRMFNGCTSLTAAPALPATTLANYCYKYMFYNCKSLTTAPELHATTLADGCYDSMFYGCTSLTTAPELPATTLTSSCYSNMFYNCTSLTTVPELHATTLTIFCYSAMFKGCTSLTAAPELPATTLANYCYSDMFKGCTSLTAAPELPATTLTSNCYKNMFYGCIALKISSTQSSEYPTVWRIPSSGTISSTATRWNTSMLANTGGTFKSDPSINTTYYGAWTK